MFNQYEPNVKVTITCLKQLRVNVSTATVNDTLQNHPDWLALLCISDSLNKWNIVNGADQSNKNDILDQLPTPFIACTNDLKTPLAIVSKVSGNIVEIFQKNYNKPAKQNSEEFLKKWNGVYLIADFNAEPGEEDYKSKKRYSSLMNWRAKPYKHSDHCGFNRCHQNKRIKSESANR